MFKIASKMMKRETKILNCIEVLFIGINKKKGQKEKEISGEKKKASNTWLKDVEWKKAGE
jgi:hypothetical protein